MIKLSVVASDIFGVSGRAMMAALVAGERDPKVLADLARGSMRGETARLEEAFTGRFTDHHAFLLRTMLARVDGIDADVDRVQARIDEQIAPFAKAVTRLDEIPGIGVSTAQVIIAEIGLDMTRFPTPDHLASWARFAPGISESAGRKKGGSSTGKGTATSPGRSVRPRSVLVAPRRSWASGTDESPNAAARNERSSPSAGPFS